MTPEDRDRHGPSMPLPNMQASMWSRLRGRLENVSMQSAFDHHLIRGARVAWPLPSREQVRHERRRGRGHGARHAPSPGLPPTPLKQVCATTASPDASTTRSALRDCPICQEACDEDDQGDVVETGCKHEVWTSRSYSQLEHYLTLR